jgi:hypothetical protein
MGTEDKPFRSTCTIAGSHETPREKVQDAEVIRVVSRGRER